MSRLRYRARMAAHLLYAFAFLPFAGGVRGEEVVAPSGKTNNPSVEPAVVLRRAPTAAPGAILYVETMPDAALEAFALARGMNVLRIDTSKIMPPAATRDPLGPLLTRYRRETGAMRVIGHGGAGQAAALLAGGFDGLLLEGADDVSPAGDMRVIAVVGADFFWSPVPPVLANKPAATNLRRFYLSGISLARRGDCPPSVADAAAPARRALLLALADWMKGVKPPASRFPGGSDLVAARAGVWPKIPGLPTPPCDARLVPPIDIDGNERRLGLVLPDRAMPIATFTVFDADRGGCSGGVAWPFASSKAEREKRADPRLSLVERYGSRAYFVATMRVVSDRLVKERLLLPEDADAYVAAAKAAPF